MHPLADIVRVRLARRGWIGDTCETPSAAAPAGAVPRSAIVHQFDFDRLLDAMPGAVVVACGPAE